MSDVEDAFPVHSIIGMDGQVAETHGFAESLRAGVGDDIMFGEALENLTHGFRRWQFEVSQEVRPDIHTQLDGPLDVKTEYILKVDVGNQLLRGLRALGLDPLNAAGQ